MLIISINKFRPRFATVPAKVIAQHKNV